MLHYKILFEITFILSRTMFRLTITTGLIMRKMQHTLMAIPILHFGDLVEN